MAGIILQTKELTKKYSGINVVNNVNIEISKGDIYGFIGANGAGKSTFMRMIAGLVKPTGGSVSLLGVHEAARLPHARKKLGVLIEQPALYNHLTATENLEVQRRYLGIRERKRINDVLEIVGLTGTGKKRAGKFSSGMRQRLGLAVALLGEPEFLMLDEPTVGLDPLGVVDLRNTLKRLNKERQTTILFSSHNLSEMTQVANRYGIIKQGTLIKEFNEEELETMLVHKRTLETVFISIVGKREG